MKFFYKIPFFIPFLFPYFLWRKNISSKNIYLTFDDGPIPEITPWILDVLLENDCKATFFCVGENIDKHPDIFKRIINEGHTIGNHTYNHLKGWNYNNNEYLKNVEKCENTIVNHIYNPKKLFRPPYGKLKPLQAYHLIKKGYKIVFWDVLSGDYNPKLSPEKCLDNVISNVTNGSIVVFHDNIKAINNVKYSLPKTLEFIKENSYKCEKL